jgi:hypothetical protein
MFMRLGRMTSTSLVAATLVVLAVTGVALGYTYTVIFGTPGSDTINESGQPGNFHIYGFQGSDTITAGLGDITLNSKGQPQIDGYDLLYGDGACTATPPNNDSYCEHPAPWLPQPWTDSPSSTDRIMGGVGPDWIIGGGGSNVIAGSQTYDVITAGPHNNTITGGHLGSAIIANHPGAHSTITVLKTLGVKGYDGLYGLPNAVDVYNNTPGDTVTCSSPTNYDVVFADKGDTVKNCYRVYYEAPSFPGSSSGALPLPFPPGMTGIPSSRDTRGAAHRSHASHAKRHRKTKARVTARRGAARR